MKGIFNTLKKEKVGGFIIGLRKPGIGTGPGLISVSFRPEIPIEKSRFWEF